MSLGFKYDAFISYSKKDRKKIYPIAEKLKNDGVNIWLDIWEIKKGENISKKTESGLEHSRVLILFVSKNTVKENLHEFESHTFRFRDPLNKQRRFIPLRIDDVSVPESMLEFLLIDWRGKPNEYAKLLDICSPLKIETVEVLTRLSKKTALSNIQLKKSSNFFSSYLSFNWRFIVTGSDHISAIEIWDIKNGSRIKTISNNIAGINSVVANNAFTKIVAALEDKTIKIWNITDEDSQTILNGHTDSVLAARYSEDENFILSSSSDKTSRLWDLQNSKCLKIFDGHDGKVYDAVWSKDQRQFISCSEDQTFRLWDVTSGKCIRIFEGHTAGVICAIWSNDNKKIATGSYDRSIRIWDVKTGQCLQKLLGHDSTILSLTWTNDGNYLISGSSDTTARVWDCAQGKCICVLQDFLGEVIYVDCNDKGHVITLNQQGNVITWDISEYISGIKKNSERKRTSELLQVEYTNAKVLLIGESGVGKTGLSRRLASDKWEASDSTIGAWATQWKLPITSESNTNREIWLWDFGGQADQRLIHQLYMDETALTVLVFDGQKEDIFETLGQWDRDISRVTSSTFTKIMVAGRIDAGGLRCSKSSIEKFAKERGYMKIIETSAKTGQGCDLLKRSIIDGIKWTEIPWRSSPLLFQLLKEHIINLKDEGRVLVLFGELRELLQFKLAKSDYKNAEVAKFTDDELRAVINLLSGPGIVQQLEFGSWILLQPEKINAYAQAVIKTIRADQHELGYLSEDKVLSGNLIYDLSIERLDGRDERFVLFAMHKILVERGICLREHTDTDTLLIFPSYYGRERPEISGHPAVLISYKFDGFLDDIYSTLVVRLHHTKAFKQDELWRYAADFKTLTNKQLGIKMTRGSEGAGEIEVYFDPTISIEEKIIFGKYIHEHLLKNGNNVQRFRHYVCSACSTPVTNRDIAMKKLEEGKKDIVCVNCEDRIPLWDDLELYFSSEELRQQVAELELKSQIILDNESKERILVGEVVSTIAHAGQISREFSVSDHGIDMEIEFKSDRGEATGRKIYLQLKSGDSYLKHRKSDGAEIFSIRERHANYWRNQAFPVFLVVRNSSGQINWMDISQVLKKQMHINGNKNIAFNGEKFDVMSVRRLRQRVLHLL